jgi:hypothetical protein
VGDGPPVRSNASPVLAEWFIAWDQWFGHQEPDGLRRYARRLVGSRGTTDQEVVRQWLVIDWLIRHATPGWLRAAGLAGQAERLETSPPVTDRLTLTGIAELTVVTARMTQDAHEKAWSVVARMAQPDVLGAGARPPWRPVPGNADPQRVQAWSGLADGTRAAVPLLSRLLGPACRATGYGPEPSADAPPVWRAAARTIGEAAAIVAWTATQRLVSTPGWSWRTPADAAWRMAHGAAGVALRPAEGVFAASACRLVEAMFRVTEVER